jgi:chromosome segregation ATPase
LSAKSVSDSLYYQYQRAYNENAIILTNRVLCDFGFVSGTSCSWGNYNYNASVIGQYNSALARTNSLAGSYSNSYSAYTNGLTRLSSLRSQSSAVNISITSLNNQAVSLQRDLGVRQVELTKAKSDNTAYEGKDVVVNRHLDSLANVESKLKTAIQEHNSNIDAFLQESNAIKVTLEGKSLSEVQNEEWTSLISELKMARTKVSTSYSLVIQTSASLLEELSKATASSK